MTLPHSTPRAGFSWRAGIPLFASAIMGYHTSIASAQTFQSVQAVHVSECQSFLGIQSCQTIQTDRLSATFAQSNLGVQLFVTTWGGAAHCTQVQASDAQCQASVSVVTDPSWNRIIWGRSGQMPNAYGSAGSGVGQFSHPMGAAMSRREGDWHVVFVADAGNNRVVILAVGNPVVGFTSAPVVKWLGAIDASETGSPLNNPQAVAWDPSNTWSLSDDRLFIADTDNHRVVVYQVGLDPVNGIISSRFLSAFGSPGTGTNQFLTPVGITVNSFGSLRTDVYVSDGANHRVSLWYYDTSDPSTPASSPTPVVQRSLPGFTPMGLTQDAYGDVLVTDYTGGLLWKLTAYALTPVKSVGGSSSWATGQFNYPTDTKVVNSYSQSPSGALVKTALPYTSTVERWTPTTGIQLHRLGVDVDSLSVNSTGGHATIAFLFTGTGSYTVTIRDWNGVTKRTFPTVVSPAAWKSVYWDGNDSYGIPVSSGQYSALIQYESGYTYDDGQPRSVTTTFQLTAPAQPLTVSISGPTTIAPNQLTTWTATASGGSGCCTYQWYRTENDGNFVRQSVGTTGSYRGSEAACWGFDLMLTGTDAMATQESATITVSISGGNCLLSVTGGPGVASAPTEYQFGQDLTPAVSTEASRSASLNRVGPPPSSVSDPGAGAQRTRIAEDIRRDGIVALRFGVPRMPVLLDRGHGSPAKPEGSSAGSPTTVAVLIRIFDLNGRLIRTAVARTLDPGYYSYVWDGRAETGTRMSPGAYIAVMTAPGFTRQTKLILTR